MAFHVGQKVVCIVEKEGNMPVGVVEPGKGDIATVARIYFFDDAEFGPSEVLVLHEYPSPPCDKYGDGWLSRYFRPIIESSTDTGMAILREILDRETDKPPVKAKPRKVEIS